MAQPEPLDPDAMTLPEQLALAGSYAVSLRHAIAAAAAQWPGDNGRLLRIEKLAEVVDGLLHELQAEDRGSSACRASECGKWG